MTITPEQEKRADEAVKIVSSIVRPTLEAGGDFISVLELLERIITGVIIIGVRDGGHDLVLNLLLKQVKAHLADVRESRKANKH